MPYFMMYYLMVPVIFLNLFVAIILEGYEQTTERVNNLVTESDLLRFQECWAYFDKKVGILVLTCTCRRLALFLSRIYQSFFLCLASPLDGVRRPIGLTRSFRMISWRS